MKAYYLKLQIVIKANHDEEIIDLWFERLGYLPASVAEDVVMCSTKLDQASVIITLFTRESNYVENLLEITKAYYNRILRPCFIESSFVEDLEFESSIEIPVYRRFPHIDKFNLINKRGVGYVYEHNCLKSSSCDLFRFSQKGKLRHILNDIYYVMLLMVGVSDIHEIRHLIAINELSRLNFDNILDMGCGKGLFLMNCVKNLQTNRFLGIDSDACNVQFANDNYNSNSISRVIEFNKADILKTDDRYLGYEMITLIEVIEHLNSLELDVLCLNIFKNIKPKHILITTPNSDYNLYLNTNERGFRHPDHEFEFSRKEFENFSNDLAVKYNYHVEVLPVGFIKENGSSISQLAIFSAF